MRTRLSSRLLPLALLIGLQIMDVAVHVAAQQIEPIRITSNAIIALGAIIAVLGAASVSRLVLLLSAAAYFVLNAVFLIQNGVVNPATASPRIPLFVFVFGSLLLVYWLGFGLRNKTRR